MISIALHRIFQILIFASALFMVLGGGFFREYPLPDEATRTVTYTLYKSLPLAPRGPSFCKIVKISDYGLVFPCDDKHLFYGGYSTAASAGALW